MLLESAIDQQVNDLPTCAILLARNHVSVTSTTPVAPFQDGDDIGDRYLALLRMNVRRLSDSSFKLTQTVASDAKNKSRLSTLECIVDDVGGLSEKLFRGRDELRWMFDGD
jgi:hypothetical protein